MTMRNRLGRDMPVEDPLAIFGAPSYEKEKEGSSVPVFVQQCCTRRNRRRWLFWSWMLIIVVMTTICCRVYHNVYGTIADSFLWRRNRNKIRPKTTKTILYYNNYWNMPHFQFGEHHKLFVDANCPVHDCVAVQNSPTFSDDHRGSFDAVLIHAPQFDATSLPEIEKWRRPGQRFIYMNMESPQSHNSPSDHRLDHFFNWTMTYRSDSDLPRPYGFFELALPGFQGDLPRYLPIQWQRQDFIPFNRDHWLENTLPHKDPAFHRLAERPKKVAWIVSRCDSPSRREDYVTELQRYIPVDILGGCSRSGMICNTTFHSRQNDNCTAAVQRNYKFYLSFENSFCNDYATEKFFLRIKGDSLLITLGGANYSRIAPPHSHLNALDYESPKALAQKLHQLDQNKSLYLSYFWWKDYYQVHTGTAQDHASTMCRLCAMLHNPSLPPKVYPSIASWHGKESQCSPQLPPAIQRLSRNQVGTNDDDTLVDD